MEERMSEMIEDPDRYWWICGDGPTELLERCPDGVDHCIVDAPYAGVVYQNARKTPGVGTYKGGNHGDQTPRDLGHAPLSDDLLQRVAESIAARCHRWALSFCDLESTHLWRAQLAYGGLEIIRTGIWHKPNAQPQITGDRPGSSCEAIVIAHGDATPMQWNRGGHDAHWDYNIEHREGRHPVEKPLALVLELVDAFTNRGDLVADITAGCATTGVACLRLGRKFFGVELDPRYYAEGARRLRATREQLGLFRATP
jgi:site-specific DNA-methyltransferase (adenine-specific)